MPGEALATIRVVPGSQITQINVRSGPGTNNAIAFTIDVGVSGLEPMNIQPDAEGKALNGKLYQWVHLKFPGGAAGWVRDDLLTIQGDFSHWGYPDLAEPSFMFALTRNTGAAAPAQPPTPQPEPAQPAETTPAQPATPEPEPAQPAAQPTQPGGTSGSGTVSAPAQPATSMSTPSQPISTPGIDPATVGSAVAIVTGSPFMAVGKTVNVRSGPGTNNQAVMKAAVGPAEMPVIDVQPDSQGKNVNGKIYQWVHMRFADGRTGWIRDDLISIKGNATPWGYPAVSETTFLFDLVRQGYELPQPSGMAIDDPERVRNVAYAITSAFEGKGYNAYNNYDRGIVSYGFIQFTLAAGSLFTVIDRYLNNSQTDVANQLRAYHSRIANRDPNLRNDMNLKNLLIQAAQDPAMQEAQLHVATTGFWKRVVDGLILPRKLQTPLTYALMFDISVNFGINAGFLRRIERDNNLPEISQYPVGNFTEQDLITQVAALRRQSHYNQAERDGLEGLKVRGDFWMRLVNIGDWGMTGKPIGAFTFNGKVVDAMNPTF